MAFAENDWDGSNSYQALGVQNSHNRSGVRVILNNVQKSETKSGEIKIPDFTATCE